MLFDPQGRLHAVSNMSLEPETPSNPFPLRHVQNLHIPSCTDNLIKNAYMLDF